MIRMRSTGEVVARLRTVQGHLQAANRMVRAGRNLDAVAQLQAVRAALGRVALQICRDHASRCLTRDPSVAAMDDLVATVRMAMVTRFYKCPRKKSPRG